MDAACFTSLICTDLIRLTISCSTGGSSPGVKRPKREADHSPSSSAEVRTAWSYTFTPSYVFTAWCLIKHREESGRGMKLITHLHVVPRLKMRGALPPLPQSVFMA